MDRLALPFSALLLTPDVSRPALEVVADDDFECTRILADGCCESSVSPSLLSSSSLMVNVLLLPLPADSSPVFAIIDMPGVTSFEAGFTDPTTLGELSLNLWLGGELPVVASSSVSTDSVPAPPSLSGFFLGLRLRATPPPT